MGGTTVTRVALAPCDPPLVLHYSGVAQCNAGALLIGHWEELKAAPGEIDCHVTHNKWNLDLG